MKPEECAMSIELAQRCQCACGTCVYLRSVAKKLKANSENKEISK